MSDPDAPGPKKPGPQDFQYDPMVAKVREAIGELLSTTIDAMSKDTEALLETNGASKTHVGAAAHRFTVEMIRMLAERVRETVPRPAAAEPKARRRDGDEQSEPQSAPDPRDEEP